MPEFTRTLFVCLLLALPAGLAAPRRSVPLVHTTDLYHPPMDPDDYVDLATVFGLPELDLRAVILDADARMVEGTFSPGDAPREPGFVPVMQLAYLTGRSVAAAIGPLARLRSPQDAALDRPRREQAGIELLLRTLRQSPEPVVVTVLGSARIVTAAFNRDPELLRRKVKSVVVNAGSSAGKANEYNVVIDVNAYVGLFRSGLPIDWYPCVGESTDWNSPEAGAEHNAFWKAPQRELFRDLPVPLMAWFVHGMTGNLRGDLLRALQEEGRGAAAAAVRADTRYLWSTASLVLAAGRTLAKTPAGWRFVPAGEVPAGAETQTLALDPVSVTIADDGSTRWQPAPPGSRVRLFRRVPGPVHTAAMTEALNALLRAIPAD